MEIFFDGHTFGFTPYKAAFDGNVYCCQCACDCCYEAGIDCEEALRAGVAIGWVKHNLLTYIPDNIRGHVHIVTYQS